MSPDAPAPPDHVWPDDVRPLSDFEVRHGITYCRRCGRMLSGDRRPGFVQVKPCRVVRITTRDETARRTQ